MLEAIILAGGFGTRLRSVVPDLPKPMAPVAGKPFLEILLTSLASKGVSRVILSLGYLPEKISSYFGNNFDGLDIAYVVESQPLGTGGGVRLAMEQVCGDHVFVLNGDTFLDLDVQAVEQQWQSRKHPIIVARQVPDTARYGRLLVVDELVTGFSEKGVEGAGLINAGCYVFSRKQLNDFSLNKPFSLETDFLAEAVQHQQVDVFVSDGQFIDIGIPEDYQRAQTELKER